jgi:hypothetical protein
MSKRQKPLAILAAALGSGALLVGLLWWWMGRTEISVVNETGQELETLDVGFPGRECGFRAVPPHAERTCSGRADRDGYISVSYRLRSGGGRTVEMEEYVNFTFGWRGVLTLRPEGGVEAHRRK